MSKDVQELLQSDTWSIAEGETPDGPVVIRFRSPVLKGEQTGDFSTLITVAWVYGEEGSGLMPSDEQTEAMDGFEARLYELWEKSGLAVLTAILTFDGARQWVWYAASFDRCIDLLEKMPEESQPYPLELDTEEDPHWGYLNDEILVGIEY
jgi:hypothetical protein